MDGRIGDRQVFEDSVTSLSEQATEIWEAVKCPPRQIQAASPDSSAVFIHYEPNLLKGELLTKLRQLARTYRGLQTRYFLPTAFPGILRHPAMYLVAIARKQHLPETQAELATLMWLIYEHAPTKATHP